MNTSRRKFLGALGIVPLSFYLQACQGKKAAVEAAAETTVPTKFTLNDFGIQLWTVKEDMAKDAKATLKSLSEYGYGQIESFQGTTGIFWGMKPQEFKTYLAGLGQTMISSHVNPEFSFKPEKMDEFKKLADDAASVGVKYLINPYLAMLKTKDEFLKASDGFNKQGAICKERGMSFAYHNHDYSFENRNGFVPIEIMLANTDKNLVDFEMDIYWVVIAQQDPVEWLTKHSGRFKLSHVKDLYTPQKYDELLKIEPVKDGNKPSASCVLGTGRIDFNSVLQVAKENGMEYFIVEQEKFDNSNPLADARSDADYMKKFRV